MLAERSYERIEDKDLRKLVRFAHEDREDFFKRHPRWERLYSERIICIALCQGAALHYIDGKNGIKDFDVWTFYAEHPKAPFPYRRIGRKDFGISKFGYHPLETENFKGRCVDLIGRSLKCPLDAAPVEALRDYLSQAITKTAKELSEKAVVLLWPPELFEKIAWPDSF